ncbi:MAG: quinolinate synthase NadA [Lentisphaerota bacterium]
MTKRDFVVKIAQETGLTQGQVAMVVQKTLDYISDKLAGARNIERRNFGIYEVRLRKSHMGRDPNKPEKEFIIVPADENCACNDCPFMKMNTLEKVYLALKNEAPQLFLSDELMKKARLPIEKMLDISRSLNLIK